jgi:hypothetical protein
VAPSVLAADSGTPQPDAYHSSLLAWGIFVAGAAEHVWTRAEAAALHEAGIEAALPIVVPPQSWPWLISELEVMVELVRQAEAWGVPRGCPLVLDVEEKWAERMGSQLPNVLGLFAGVGRAAAFFPVVYGSARTLGVARGVGRFLAAWSREPGSAPPPMPELPAGLFAWQYAGNAPYLGAVIDLDLIAVPTTLMATDFAVPSGLVTVNEEGVVMPVLTRPKTTIAPPAEPEAVAPTAEEIAEVETPAVEPPAEPEAVAPTAEEIAEVETPAVEPPAAPVPYADAVALPLHEDGTFGIVDEYSDVAAVGDGYLAVTRRGRVVAVRVPHLGEPGVDGCIAITPTPSGAGYYVLTEGGLLFHYGDAGTKAAEAVKPETPTDG